MSVQPGWHPDPAPGSPGAPPQLRYWDGERWTEHTAPYPVGGGPVAVGGGATGGQGTTTPDGVALASWWHRVGATLLDALIVIPITAVLDIPFYGRIIDAFRDYVDRLDDAARTGASPPSSTQFQQDLFPTFLGIAVVGLVFSLVWVTVWLRTKQGTPGMLITGLRVRQRDTPGPLPYGVIWRRWAGQYAVTVVGIIPIVGSLASLYTLLDVLWAAWDSKRQTLHDKLAGTNVIRVR